MRNELFHSDIVSIKIQLREMLKLSKDEYRKSKNANLSPDERRAYFQQAVEKMYKTMIHIIELKSGYNIRGHNDLFDPFYWRKAGFHAATMDSFLSKMNLLHNYFYEGGVYPSPSIERTYKSLLEYVESKASQVE